MKLSSDRSPSPPSLGLSEYSRNYLQQYWPESPTHPAGWADNMVLMAAYQNAATAVLKYFSHPVSTLDISTGPALGPLLAMQRCVSEVQLSDFQEENRICIQRLPVNYWRNYVPMLSHSIPHAADFADDILARLDQLRCQHLPVHVDLFSEKIFPSGFNASQFKLVMMHFVADSITKDKSTYFSCLKRVTDLVTVGSVFVMSALVDSSSWKIGDIVFPSPRITEKEVTLFLENQGFSLLQLDRSERSPDQTYDGGWIVTSGFRSSALRSHD